MVFFSVFCDVLGYFTRNIRLFEVSCWNLLIASLAVFFAVILGQFEAALADPYEAAQSTLTWHTLTGWSLSAIIVGMSLQTIILIRSFIPSNYDEGYFGVRSTTLFWHFVDGIWVILFSLLYLW